MSTDKRINDSLVIIPTYNEKENIEQIIQAVLSFDSFDILIVDDGSPDGTADIVKSIQRNGTEEVFILEREGKQGLGTAYIAGFKWGIERKYDYIFEMDADFSHNPNDLPRLLRALKRERVGVVVGSRYTPGGQVENWPLNRQLISYGASLYVRMITWMPVKDPTAGFVGYRREVLEKIALDKIEFVGYAFQIEMKFAAWQNNFRIVELPITFKDRTKGTSKMSSSIVGEAIKGVIKMKWQSLFGSRFRK